LPLVQSNELFFDTGLHSYFGFSGGTRRDTECLTNRFEQASDDAFIRERADRAAETYERVRLEGYPPEGAQELAMDTLLRGLRYSKYAILREVVENEFANEVPEKKREAFIRKLLPPVGNVFSAYDLSDDNFALSPEYDLLYTELTGAAVLYIDEYGV